MPYVFVPFDTLTIKIVKLSLTLIEVVKICILQRNSRMSLINL
jgi:hypothetical protein